MKIAIRGDLKSGLLRKYIEKNYDADILYDVDRESTLWSNDNKRRVVSPMKMREDYLANKVDKIFLSPEMGIENIYAVMKELKAMDIDEQDVYVPSIKELKECKEDAASSHGVDDLKQLYYLEYHIQDNCNLNCSGCSHFSSLVKKTDPSVSVEEIRKDLLRLHEIINHIEWIRVMGGEPLLNKDWKEYLKVTREIWKYSKLSLVTNGLLLKSLKKEDFDLMKELDVQVDISVYKPIWGSIDDIVACLKEAGIRYRLNSEPVTCFTSCFDLNSTDNFVDKRKQCDAPCFNLRKGKMSPCPVMMYVDFFNEYFGTDIPEGCPVDIYEKDLTFEALVRKIKEPMRICRFCNQSVEHTWERCSSDNIKIDNWLV